MLFYNCSVFIYSTVAGHKCEINLIVIVMTWWMVEPCSFCSWWIEAWVLQPGWEEISLVSGSVVFVCEREREKEREGEGFIVDWCKKIKGWTKSTKITQKSRGWRNPHSNKLVICFSFRSFELNESVRCTAYIEWIAVGETPTDSRGVSAT